MYFACAITIYPIKVFDEIDVVAPQCILSKQFYCQQCSQVNCKDILLFIYVLNNLIPYFYFSHFPSYSKFLAILFI